MTGMHHGNEGYSTSETNRGGNEVNLRVLFATLKRNKWIALLITLVVINLMLLRSFIQEPEFEAVAVVQAGNDAPAEPFEPGEGSSNILNEIEYLKSRQLARDVAGALLRKQYREASVPFSVITVVDDQSGVTSLASLDAVAGRLQSALTVENVPRSDIIEIRIRSHHPDEAAALANLYADVYVQKATERLRTRSTALREFLETQLESTGTSLRESEHSLQKYMEESGVVGLDEESEYVIERAATLEARRDELAMEIASAERSLEMLREQLSEQEIAVAADLTAADNRYIMELQQQISELQMQRDLALSLNPGAAEQPQYNAQLQDIDRRIGNIQSALRERSSQYIETLGPGDEEYLRSVKQEIAERQIEMQGLKIEKSYTDSAIVRLEQQFGEMPGMNTEYVRLERARQSREQFYLMVEESYNEAVIAEQSEPQTVSIIDDAVPSDTPVNPDVRTNLAAGVVLGLIFGVGFVFVREAFTARIRTPDDLKKIDAVNLATIANMYHEVRQIGSKGWTTVKGRVISSYLITWTKPMSPVSEAFRSLRTNIQHRNVDQPMRTIVVTSPNPGEGKTTIAANLAVAFAQAGLKTLIIDADLRKPAVHSILDLDHRRGLSDILLDERQAAQGVQKTITKNLTAVACGSRVVNPADLLSSRKMRQFIEKTEKFFDIVLFDTPPILAATDAAILSTGCDGVLLVASSGNTKTDELEVAIESIEAVQGTVMGVVLNKFDLRDGYSDGGMYYRYGTYGETPNPKQRSTAFRK